MCGRHCTIQTDSVKPLCAVMAPAEDAMNADSCCNGSPLGLANTAGRDFQKWVICLRLDPKYHRQKCVLVAVRQAYALGCWRNKMFKKKKGWVYLWVVPQQRAQRWRWFGGQYGGSRAPGPQCEMRKYPPARIESCPSEPKVLLGIVQLNVVTTSYERLYMAARALFTLLRSSSAQPHWVWGLYNGHWISRREWHASALRCVHQCQVNSSLIVVLFSRAG